MILAGCRGTGKSTFLNTLIGESLAKETKDRIDGQVRTRRYSLVESKFDLDLTVVDMPDFAANIDNQYTWLPIVKYIESQFRQYLLQEEQPRRELLTDSRVHVCVYFISPTNTELSTLDIESMKEISKRVTLIPVIARSDTLNKEELVHFKGIINRTLQDNEIDISKYLQHESVAEKLAQHAPYAIIGSNTMYKNADGNFVRARKYGWGMVEVENAEHCDFVHIRDLLMLDHMLDLMSAMDHYYNSFRTEFLRARIRSQRKSGDEAEQIGAAAEDGLASYKVYNPLLTRESQCHLEKYSGEGEALDKEVRLRLEKWKTTEEVRLREWKKRIHNIQTTHNADLDQSWQKIDALEKAILMIDPDEKDNLQRLSERVRGLSVQKAAVDQESIVAPSLSVG